MRSSKAISFLKSSAETISAACKQDTSSFLTALQRWQYN
jgi:hypothetical protein